MENDQFAATSSAEIYRQYFDRISSQYKPLSRYSFECISTCITHLRSHLPVTTTSFLDIGSGDGCPAAACLSEMPWIRITCLDASFPMLELGRARLNSYPHLAYAFVQGEAMQLPFLANTFDVVLSSCMIHLVENRFILFREAARVLKSGGSICILTYDHADLEQQLVHRYFPLFNNIDRNRHPSIATLIDELRESGFAMQRRERFPYEFQFAAREEFLTFIQERPFSGFAHYSDTAFRDAFNQFARCVEKEIPIKNVTYKSALTALIAKTMD